MRFSTTCVNQNAGDKAAISGVFLTISPYLPPNGGIM